MAVGVFRVEAEHQELRVRLGEGSHRVCQQFRAGLRAYGELLWPECAREFFLALPDEHAASQAS